MKLFEYGNQRINQRNFFVLRNHADNANSMPFRVGKNGAKQCFLIGIQEYK